MKPQLTVILFGFLLVAKATYAGETVQIEIQSTWDGLGNPRNNSFLITGKNGRYTAEGYNISPKAVAELLAALESPIADQPLLEECGISEKWLMDNYAKGLEEYTHRKIRELSPKQVDLFRSRFINLPNAQTAFAELFKHWHTDDYPNLSVSVKSDERLYGVRSESQYPFMLPWIGTDRGRGGYSCKISRAIANLVPKDFPNRSRLVLGDGFRWDLTGQIMNSIRDEWDMLDTEYKVGSAVAPVFARFTPLKSAISILSSIDLDGRESWNAELHSPDLPANFVIGVSLLYRKKELKGVDALLTQVPQYTKLVLSVPWLRKYLEDHPEARIELRYVNGRSLSLIALANLTEDLQKHSKTELAEAVSRQGAESAFLEIYAGACCWSRAIVLPSREVILWHFKGDSTLGFAAKDFDNWDYIGSGWRSAGTLIGLDGMIEK
jgi:hypothetical protein